MNPVDLASGVSAIGSPARNAGSTIQPGVGRLIGELDARRRWSDVRDGTLQRVVNHRAHPRFRPEFRDDADRFVFQADGSGSGTKRLVSTSISVSSSDSNRHPRATSAAQSVLFPDPGGAGITSARPARSTTAP